MILFLFIFIFLIGIVIAAYAIHENTDIASFAIFGTLCIITGLIVSLVLMFPKTPKPQAIDVYKGKTTLQITYQDSIPIDTVVVWK